MTTKNLNNTIGSIFATKKRLVRPQAKGKNSTRSVTKEDSHTSEKMPHVVRNLSINIEEMQTSKREKDSGRAALETQKSKLET